ncbi:MAG: peptidoglycan DD-metalloendopeptidase family protein [Hyphomicrobiaceae bacterium]
MIAGLALAGCSADVIRLDSPASFSLSDKSSPMTRPAAAMSRSGAGAGSLVAANETYAAPANTGGSVKMAALPDTAIAPSYQPAPAAVPSAAAPKTTTAPAPAASSDRGEAIQIKQGDTLFGLSKKYHASVAELMSVNGLTSPNLKPGQTLYLPVGKNSSKKPLTRTGQATNALAATSPVAQPMTPPSAAVLAKYDGSYTVKKGDSLYALALQLKVPMTELQQVNGIADVRKVRPGAVLKVPAASVATLPAAQVSVAAASTGAQPKVPTAVVQKEAAATVPSPTQPVILNSKKVAAIDLTKSDAAPSAEPAAPAAAAPVAPVAKGTQVAAAGDTASAAIGKLRWPVKGKVIGTFGPRPDGIHNDGVNLSVPLGTEVHAAEAGEVVYAGSELKGYGNLILVRHVNGWITAYAHNDELIAKRGDKVKRGQVVAKAGKSGQIDQPQVHFELRQGSKPVDPTPFMEKL